MARSPGYTDAGDADLPLIYPERRRELLRRWWRSRGHRRNLSYWLLFRGGPVLLAYTTLYVVSGFVLGWRDAYDVSLGIESPADVTVPALAWFLSVAGWLLMPGIAGAVAGYVVSNSISARRSRSLGDSFPGAGISRQELREILRELNDE